MTPSEHRPGGTYEPGTFPRKRPVRSAKSLKRQHVLLRVLFWVVSLLTTAFVIGGIFAPREVYEERKVMVTASQLALYDYIQNFKKWDQWAPWFQQDQFIDRTFEGAESGRGAVMHWKGKDGADGQIKIVSAMTPKAVNMTLLTEQGEANTWFKLEDAGKGLTTVTWGFHTDFGFNPARRYFGLIFAQRVRRNLDDGLENLKNLAEQAPAGVPVAPPASPAPAATVTP